MLIDTIETPDGPIYVYDSTEPEPRPQRRRKAPPTEPLEVAESTEAEKTTEINPMRDPGTAFTQGVPAHVIRGRWG